MLRKIQFKRKKKRLMWCLIQFSKTPNLKKIRKPRHCMEGMRMYRMQFLIKRLGRWDKAIVQKEAIEL